MMENPFFRNYWSSSRPRYTPTPTTRGFQSPKVVSIPIHFVGSEKRRSEAAVKIQKVFRGFMVRKNVRRIVAIKREVEEIERKVSERETVEAVRRDARERLRMNEMLMALLFRLDSIRGVDSGVRECRKGVIRKAISLQERIDAIVEENQSEAKVDDEEEGIDGGRGAGNGDLVDPSSRSETAEEGTGPEVIDIVKDSADSAENAIDQSSSDDQKCIVEASVESSAEKMNSDLETETNSEMKLGEEEDSAEAETTVTAATQAPSIQCSEETVNEENSMEMKPEDQVKEEQEMETEPEQKLIEETETEEDDGAKGLERGESSVLMEKMLKDNEKLMGLVSQLCERNAMQTQMISSLSQRVENLEKAFICEKLKRKKKRNASGAGEKQDCTPDARKCGRKL